MFLQNRYALSPLTLHLLCPKYVTQLSALNPEAWLQSRPTGRLIFSKERVNHFESLAFSSELTVKFMAFAWAAVI